jgi:hypothetical protein
MATNPENVETEDTGPIPRVHELTWALVDEQITDAQMEELETLLLGDSVARNAYVRCMQLHADLASHFVMQVEPDDKTATKTPILGFLNEGLPQYGTPTSDNAKA